jgi:hypothetical protein
MIVSRTTSFFSLSNSAATCFARSGVPSPTLVMTASRAASSPA